MNKILLQSCLVLLTVLSIVAPISKPYTHNSNDIRVKKLGIDYDYIYCQAGDHAIDRHVPFRDYKAWMAKGGGTLGDFEVTYTGFTQEAQDAFQFAVDLWDMLLDSPAKIIVDANFADLNSGVLGSAAPTAMYANFSDKVDKNIEFAAPLADKIAERSINGAEADLRCNFNSSTNWFYDFNNTDAITGNQFDFVSVVLHELGHGLGFLSRNAFTSTSGTGFIRAEAPLITDIFSLLLEQGNGTNLLLNFEEATTGLGGALTSSDVFLNTRSVSPLPKIFAPIPWSGGSSLSHLDESTFDQTDPLMTPSIGPKEVIHDPGIALDMMNDMGWRSSFVAHRASNSELISSPLSIVADIFTDEGVGFDSASVLLVYSQDSFGLFRDTMVMISTDQSSRFVAELSGNNSSGRYQYYITLADSINRGYSSPLLAQSRYHDVQIGVDNSPPIIEHTAVEFFFLNEDQPVISAEVIDAFTGIDTAVIEYSVNGGPIQIIGMRNVKFDLYEQGLDIDVVTLSDGDVIEYRLKATDNAIGSNVSLFPADGFFLIMVKDVPSEVEFYENDFENATTDFSFDGFSIRSENGFNGVGLHTEHPYLNAGTGNILNFTAGLRIPVKVVEGGVIEFDEVVLVEPAEAGNNFGDAQFWDYVIVEVTKEVGSIWIPLADGYDSGEKTFWNTRYSMGVDGQNSSSSGDESLMRRRSIPLHQPALGLNVGDVVFIRWRLYSDPFATGWGWVIDDLVIQKEQNTTPVVQFDATDRSISIVPNPVDNDLLYFTLTKGLVINQMSISDSSGRLVYQANKLDYRNDRGTDISTLRPGVYFVLFKTDRGSISKRFLKL